MTIVKFVESLIFDGRVRVSTIVDAKGKIQSPSPAELAETLTRLRRYEELYRPELRGNPPGLLDDGLYWGALMTYRACSFLAHRDVDSKTIVDSLQKTVPPVASPAVCYSVDFTCRFLPDLIRLAKAVSVEDPLVGCLITLARQWPLSSVGVPDLGAVDISAFVRDDCLLALYVDRVIASGDASRLDHPLVLSRVRTAIGLHSELSPGLAQVLASISESE